MGRAPLAGALLPLLLAAAPVSALEDDTEQPVHIVADEAVRDENAGLTIYRGHVEMEQGSIRVAADEVTIHHQEPDGGRIVALGAPARMRRQVDLEGAMMRAHGNIIEYFRAEKRVLLREDAELEQEGATVRSERIDYFIDRGLVKAGGEGEGEDTGKRVRVVIPPRNRRSRPALSVLRASHLAKQYRGRPVVRDVSLEISSGEIVGLLGPNGAGKTTCFYMIIGLVAADQGSITMDGQDISALPMHGRARRGIGYLPQEASIFRHLSVLDNLLAVLQCRGDLSRAERREKADRLLEEFHISHLRDNTGLSLSGGERRRVEIARALAAEPDFILLDEPFAGVDPISVHDLRHIIGHLQARDIGVLITDHNARETLHICDKAYIVGEGHIIASGAPADILADDRVREIYLGTDFHL